MKVRIEVFLKPGVLDVQGKAVENALHGLGWPAVKDVRVGRLITLQLSAADPVAAEAQAKEMCDKLLANPVIESWRVEIEAGR
ncbi:MAG: phosphoribosylformylglycinamidine synthase subunit PurS [Caulobacteraceae bacterium]